MPSTFSLRRCQVCNLVVTFLVVGCYWSAHAVADNWPQWRGAAGNGISSERSIPSSWSANNQVAWRTAMPGQGGATPTVWGDRLFVTSADGDDLVLICLQTTDGSQLWKRKVTTGNKIVRGGEGNFASASPSTDGEHVWVFFATGILACYDFDGNEIWKIDVGQRFGELDIQFGMTSTPVLDGDALYLQLIHGPMRRGNSAQTGKVVKLNKSTGETIWEHDRKTNVVFECKHSYASPFIYDDGARRFLVVHGADCTTGHSLESGKELWRLSGLNGPTEINRKEHDATFRFIASPATSSGYIVIPTAKGGPTVTLHVAEGLQGNLNEQTHAIKWTLPNTPDVSIPLIVDGLVYMLHKNGTFQCVELDTGNEIYFERISGADHRASPLYAGDHIYVCGKDGFCKVIKAGREFEIVASNDMQGEPISASPIVANGTLYIRTYDAVYAIRN